MTARLAVAVVVPPTTRQLVLPHDLQHRLELLGREVADVAEADVLLTSWGSPRVDAALLRRAPRLSCVLHAAGSVKHVVGDDVWDRGILVSSAAVANAAPVADFTLAMIQLAAKRVLPLAAGYRQGHRADITHDHRVGLPGKTVGVVAASKIGRLVVEGLAARGCQVLLNDPHLRPSEATLLGARLVGLDELMRASDVVTLHAPLLPETRHMVDRRRLALMRPGAVLINTARGGLVDTVALVEACASSRIDAILDVTDPEPLPVGHALLGMDNVVVTTHVAGAVGSEVRQLGAFALDELERRVHGLPLVGLVTRDQLTSIA